jgi:hypothetical protein
MEYGDNPALELRASPSPAPPAGKAMVNRTTSNKNITYTQSGSALPSPLFLGGAAAAAAAPVWYSIYAPPSDLGIGHVNNDQTLESLKGILLRDTKSYLQHKSSKGFQKHFNKFAR